MSRGPRVTTSNRYGERRGSLADLARRQARRATKWSDDQLRRMAPAEHTHPSAIADDRDLTHSHDGGAMAHAHPTYEYQS